MENSKNVITKYIIIIYVLIILLGGLLLSLPISNKNNSFNNIIDSIFHSTSSVCVTGLSLFSISGNYTIFGQIVILLLIQIGGLGFMIISTMLFILLGKKISLKDRLIIKESINSQSLDELTTVVFKIFIMTFIIEGIGFLLLCFVFVPEFGFLKGSYYALFTSISAFCNAGFDILPFDNSLINYYSNTFLNLVVIILIILGGLGYIVIFDIIKNKTKISFHSKIVLLITSILITISFLTYFVFEYNNTMKDFSFNEKILSSFFLAVTTRTAGFQTISSHSLSLTSKIMMMFNMFIGGSPASTAGGIKTTTMFVVIVYFINSLNNSKEVSIKKTTIPLNTVNKAVSIFILSLLITFISTFLISIIEPQYSLEQILFEVTSALQTVGLSVGVTSNISSLSKLIFSFLMFAGRIGVLSIVIIFITKKTTLNLKYKESKILIG